MCNGDGGDGKVSHAVVPVAGSPSGKRQQQEPQSCDSGLSGGGDSGDGVTMVAGPVDTATGKAAAVWAVVMVHNCA